jgi:opacity protein-like surface antigen
VNLNKIILALLTAGFIVISPDTLIAETNNSPYLGIQYALGDVGVSDLSESFSPTTLIGRVGRYFNDHYAIEGRFAFPVRDDQKTTAGGDVSVGLFGLVGAYGAAHLNLGKRFSFYGIAGLSLVKGEIESAFMKKSGSELQLSYGIGADIGLGSSILNIEYFSYSDDSNFDFDALGLGIKIVF